MDAVTYPHTDVIEALNQHFVPIHLNIAEPTDTVKTKMREFRLRWTPLLIWMDHRGTELRRQVGYFPPDEFLAELAFARGLADLHHGRPLEARTLFLKSANDHPDSATAPEGLYWAGVAASLGGEKEELKTHWNELRKRYPQSSWWTRASFIG